jgi:hypothetical protein
MENEKKQLDASTQHHLAGIERAKKREHEALEKARQIEKELKILIERKEAHRPKSDFLNAELQSLQPCAD